MVRSDLVAGLRREPRAQRRVADDAEHHDESEHGVARPGAQHDHSIALPARATQQPQDPRHTEDCHQRDRENVAADCRDEIATREVIDGAQTATAWARFAGQREERTVAIAARAVRIVKVQEYSGAEAGCPDERGVPDQRRPLDRGYERTAIELTTLSCSV